MKKERPNLAGLAALALGLGVSLAVGALVLLTPGQRVCAEQLESERTSSLGREVEAPAPLLEQAAQPRVAPTGEARSAAFAPLSQRVEAPAELPRRTGRVEVTLTRDGRHVDGTLRFIAGPHLGRAPVRVESGVALAADCLPGLSLVRIEGDSGGFTEREVRIRRGRLARLAVDFGDYGSISGRVTDAEGRGLVGASVELGDQRARTDHAGAFRIDRTSSGRELIIVRAEGHATVSRTLPAGRAGDVEEVPPFALVPSASVTIRAAGAGAGTVQLLPVASGAGWSGRAAGVDVYPWTRVGPLELTGGSSLRLDDLPPCGLRMVAIGAAARGSSSTVWLRSGVDVPLVVELERAPVLRGRVVLAGEPVAGATIELAPLNEAGARREVLGDDRDLIDRHPVGSISGLRRVTTSSGEGEFRMQAFSLRRERSELRVSHPTEPLLSVQAGRRLDGSTVRVIDLSPGTSASPSPRPRARGGKGPG